MAWSFAGSDHAYVAAATSMSLTPPATPGLFYAWVFAFNGVAAGSGPWVKPWATGDPPNAIGPAGVGTVLLASQTLSATSASFDFAGLSAAFSHLRIYALLRGTAAAVSVNAQIRFNNDSGANYDDQAVYAHATTAGGAATSAGTSAIFGGVTASNATAGEYGIVVAELPFYTATNARKTFAGTSTSYDTAGTTSTYWTMVQGGSWRNSAAVNQVTIFPASGSWAAGSAVSVYGVA